MNYIGKRLSRIWWGLALFCLLLALQPATAAAGLAANHLVISEIQTAGADPNTSQEFIELYNPTGQTVFLEGWSIQYASPGTGLTAVAVAPLGVGKYIPAYGYFLLRPVTLPGADAGYSFDLNAAGGAIYLVKSTTALMSVADVNIADRVAYGTGENPEHSQAPAPAAGQSIERLPGQNFSEGSGIDTDNNSADWVVRAAPQPQTAGSAAQVAVGPAVTGLTPPHGSTIAAETVTVTATVSDNSSGVDPARLLLYIDNEFHGIMAYTGITATRTVNLSQGTHTVLLLVDDLAGYTSETQWIFTVDTVAPSLGLTITDGSPKNTKLLTTVELNAVDNPLGRSSGISQMRLAFDGALDTEPWESFQPVVVRNLMDKEGLQAIVAQVMDKAGNVSAVATATTVLELTPSAAPDQAISSTTDSIITITWPAVPGATQYLIRYSDGQILFGPLTAETNSIIITDLDPNKKYTFEVAAVNPAGTVSGFTKVVPPEQAVKITAAKKSAKLPSGGPVEPPIDTISSPAPTPIQTPTPAPIAESTSSPTPEVSPSPQVKADNDTQSPDWTRVIVALSILIIAAGIATGGWYLYQWWSTRPGSAAKGKGKGKTGRW